MTACRLALSLALAAGFVCAQAAEPLEIRGTVIEPGFNLGVVGAEVTLSEFVLDADKSVVRKAVATTSTDSRGAFQFKAGHSGRYFVEAKKEGYQGNPGNPVELDGTRAGPEIRFTLSRPGEITGRVLDEDGKPVSLDVSLYGPEPGIALAGTGTDKDGNFNFPKVAPGNYALLTAPMVLPDASTVPRSLLASVSAQISEEDIRTVDLNYEASYWPGVDDFDLAARIQVSPGGSVSLGTITARKVPYYRAHLSVTGAQCGQNEKWAFSVIPSKSAARDLRTIPCGTEFLIRNLKPGSYTFAVTSSNPLERGPSRASAEGLWALAPVEITNQNVEVPLTMTGGTNIRGRLVPVDGATLPPAGGIQIVLVPVAGIPTGGNTATLDSERRFTLNNVQWPRHRILVNGIPGSHYIQEVRINGRAASPGDIPLGTGAPAQMEIVIDDKPALLTGTVMEGDKPAGRAQVVLVKWPYAEHDPFSEGVRQTVANQGKFQFAGLAPGEYRVLALPSAIATRDLSSLLVNQAERVVLERNSSRDVTVKLAGP